MENQQGNPVVHFEIGCRDSAKTQEFYQRVFGWKISPATHNVTVDTQSNKGISGSITSLGHEPHQYIMFYIEVESVSESINEIEANGGQKHIGPLPTGSGQFFAWAKDPGGNMIGILSNNE